MSRFCGKCDVYDVLVAIMELNDDSDWSKIHIYKYIEDLDEDGFYKREKLDINSIKDLVPYFPFLEYSGGQHDDAYSCTIGVHSFIYTEEREHLSWILKKAQKEYRKCKRNKEEFIVNEVAKKITYLGTPDENTIEICKRVKEHPYSVKLDGLHTSLHNYFRNELMEEMIKYGYTKEQAYEWCYNNKKTW